MARPSAALDVRLRAPQQQLIPVGRRAWMAAGRCCCCWACHACAPACASSHTSQALTAASPRRTDRETDPWSHSPAGTAVGRPAHVSGLGQSATIHTACDCCASARRLHPGVRHHFCRRPCPRGIRGTERWPSHQPKTWARSAGGRYALPSHARRAELRRLEADVRCAVAMRALRTRNNAILACRLRQIPMSSWPPRTPRTSHTSRVHAASRRGHRVTRGFR